MHRKVALKDHKLVYWLAGGLSALSVLLEKKARRGELALYVLPRAGESLWYILVNRRLLPDIKNAEVSSLYGLGQNISLLIVIFVAKHLIMCLYSGKDEHMHLCLGTDEDKLSNGAVLKSFYTIK